MAININKKPHVKDLTYISLFSGAGVGCYGFKQQNFKCIATNELIEKRLNIQKYNKKCIFESGYVCGNLSNKEIKNKVYNELKTNNVKNLDVLIATAPCQGMSVANHKKKNEITRNSLIVESIKITKNIKPKIFIFENVRSFLNTTCTDVDNISRTIDQSIKLNLAGNYNILSKIINFKDYGSQSSRTRTLIIGVRKDLIDISPYKLFPKKQNAKILKQLIYHLPILKNMGDVNQDDIYHSFRNYDKKMLPWIENIKEGQSAFDNKEYFRIPHKIINNKIVFNKNINGDKYSRCYWNRVAPCVHTRNDILSSQSTIHPEGNRVFSIKELMKMMTIPDEFNWSNIEYRELNKLSLTKKNKFLKDAELNIRKCIGESVPTAIFQQIATNIKKELNQKKISINNINEIIKLNNLTDNKKLKKFLKNNPYRFTLNTLFIVAELSNTKKIKTKAYFTRESVVFNIVNNLPDFKNKKTIKILEPSVGIGNFLFSLFNKYENCKNVVLDVIDIDINSIEVMQILLQKIKIPINFTINFICKDFLFYENSYNYDLIVGNPPFGKIIKNKSLLDQYKIGIFNQNTNNIFSFFIEKALRISKYVSLITPKSLINSPEFNQSRKLLEKQNIYSLTDYGEKGFKGVKIETMSFLLDTYKKSKNQKIKIESYITNEILYQHNNYIFDKAFPYWLIYRNSFFDTIVDKMELGIFKSFRDRQITKKHTLCSGVFRVLKSRNIDNNRIIDINNYDCFINEINNFAVSKFLNKNNIVLVPNLTYNPRATFLPKNAITDGSVALLTLKDNNIKIANKHLKYYSSDEFSKYYAIARNRGTRSLNIDSGSVQFFGLLKNI